jgi:uncharacterized protein YndB with AHSA1/START domain
MNTARTATEVRRRFAASPDKVFGAFADADLVARWLKPAPEIRLEVLQFEFRVGGGYRFAYHLPDGSAVFIGGAFRSIERPLLIVFSWIIEPPDVHAGIESEVTVNIAPDAAGVELVIRHEKLERIDAVERHQGGWRGALALLAEMLEIRSPTT